VKDARDVIPWKVTDISIRPFADYWSFNPSITFDGSQWLCVLRNCDYAMPESVTIRSKNALPTGQQTKNAMVIFDPDGWKPIKIYKMHERDDHPRASTPHVGYEDMRIFRTDKGGLQGIAASLHLRRDGRPDGSRPNQVPEQVLLSFNDVYEIVKARPIRGDGWGSSQKNWVPFDNCIEPRFLFSIDKGRMFDEHGPVHGDAAVVRPSVNTRSAEPIAPPLPITAPVDVVELPQQQQPQPQVKAPKQRDRRPSIRGGDVRVARGRRMMLDAGSARAARPASKTAAARRGDEATRIMGTGRTGLPSYNGLRGGTQLVRVGDDTWLGIGHEMKWTNHKKYYWHVFYLVNARGKVIATSEPMKLASNTIEFAAGMAIDGDRVVVSFGVDDMESKIGETKLPAVMEILRPIAR